MNKLSLTNILLATLSAFAAIMLATGGYFGKTVLEKLDQLGKDVAVINASIPDIKSNASAIASRADELDRRVTRLESKTFHDN